MLSCPREECTYHASLSLLSLSSLSAVQIVRFANVLAGTLHIGDIVRVTRITDPDIRKLDVDWVNPQQTV